jgi:hypothetical protein
VYSNSATAKMGFICGSDTHEQVFEGLSRLRHLIEFLTAIAAVREYLGLPHVEPFKWRYGYSLFMEIRTAQLVSVGPLVGNVEALVSNAPSLRLGNGKASPEILAIRWQYDRFSSRVIVLLLLFRAALALQCAKASENPLHSRWIHCMDGVYQPTKTLDFRFRTFSLFLDHHSIEIKFACKGCHHPSISRPCLYKF